MKFERTALLQALNIVKPALAAKDLIPALTHCWFDGEMVTAYNDADLGIQTPCKTPFGGGIKGSLLLGLLSNSRAKEVDFEFDKEAEGQMVMKAARLRAKLAVMDPKEALWRFPQPAMKNTVDIDEHFMGAMKAVLVSVGANISIPEQLGMTIIVDRGWNFYTTDSKTIARAQIKAPKGAPLKDGTRVILPTAFCKQVLGLCADGGFMEIRKDCAIAGNADGVLIYARLVDFEQPRDLPGVFAKHVKHAKEAKFEIPPRLALALERALVLLEGLPSPAISFHAIEGRLRLETVCAGRGDMKDSVDIPDTVPEIAIRADPELIKRALPLCTHMVISENAVFMSGENSFGYLASTSGG